MNPRVATIACIVIGVLYMLAAESAPADSPARAGRYAQASVWLAASTIISTT